MPTPIQFENSSIAKTELLFITTSSSNIQQILQNQFATHTEVWLVSKAQVQILTMYQPIFDDTCIVLADESKDNQPYIRALLKKILENHFVHWVYHDRYNYWIDLVKKAPNLILRESGHNGTAHQLLRSWLDSSNKDENESKLQEFFQNNRQMAIELEIRRALNNKTNKDLIQWRQKLLTDTGNLTTGEQLLVARFPDLLCFLEKFSEDLPDSASGHLRSELANAFFTNLNLSLT